MMKLINIQMIMMLNISFLMILTYSMNFNNNKTHPLIMISILLMLLIFSAMNLSIYFNNHWFSFIMFIIMVGGMMVIFLYFISFINNMKTSMKWMFLKFIPLKIFLTISMFFIMLNLMFYSNWMMNFNEIMPFYKIFKFNELNLTYMYIYPKNISTLLAMIYLLISLTIIVKICLIKKFTLRKFN